jgi:hypothetical protein
MSRLVLFGDSFATQWPNDYAWTNQLAKKFDGEQVNYAIGGSSIEYSLFQFSNYMKKNHRETDKIVFILSHPSRSPIVHPEYDPAKSADKSSKNAINKQWLQLHLHLARYIDYDTSCYKYFIAASVLNSIKNDALLICAFDNCKEKSTRENFVVSEICLFDYSVTHDKETVNHFSKYGTSVMNHFLEPNHNAMAECAYQSFIHKKDMFDPNLFTVKKHNMRDWLVSKIRNG